MARHNRHSYRDRILVRSVHKTPLRYTSPSEAQQLVDSNKARYICRRCGHGSDTVGQPPRGRCQGHALHDMVIQNLFLERHDTNSPASISAREMEANVGIAGMPLESPRRGAISAAQAKIKIWPFIGDTKAVRVGIKA